jgi:cytochrome c oxidase subunit 2
MMDPMAKIHRGFQPIMPAYQGVLAPADVGALVEYIRSLKDVEAQPADPGAWLRTGPPEQPMTDPGPLGVVPARRGDRPPYPPGASQREPGPAPYVEEREP